MSESIRSDSFVVGRIVFTIRVLDWQCLHHFGPLRALTQLTIRLARFKEKEKALGRDIKNKKPVV